MLNFPDAKVDDGREVEAIFGNLVTEASKDRPPFILKRPPMDHQTVAFEKLKEKNVWAIFGDVGSGKSKILTDLATNAYCNNEIDAVIIVAINRLVIEQWHDSQLPRDIHESIPYKSWVWNKTKKANSDYEQLKKSTAYKSLQST